MLWHQKTGPIFTGSMTEYQLIEADNMQPDTDPLSIPLTPRIELRRDTAVFMNICDLDAKIEREITHDSLIIKTRSKLVNKNQQDPKSGELNCRVNYHFTDKSVRIQFSFDKSLNDGKVKIILPVISNATEKFSLANTQLCVYKGSAILQIKSTARLTLMPTTTKNRVFNYVPGLEAIPLSIDQNEATITIEII
jgi:hypothetical protein